MLQALYLLAGALLGVVFIFVVERAGDSDRRFGLALLVAAGIYAAFAMAAMESAWLAIELTGLTVFGTFVFLGWKRTPLWLAAGWVLHVAWDVGLHIVPGAPFVPSWYPVACVSFDLIVAVHIARSAASALRPRTAEVLP